MSNRSFSKKLRKSFVRIKGNLGAKRFRHLPRKPLLFVTLQLKFIDDLTMKSSDEFRSHLGETENTKSMSILMAMHNLI